MPKSRGQVTRPLLRFELIRAFFVVPLIKRLRDKRAEVGLHYMLRILVLDFLVPSRLFDTRDFALMAWDLHRSLPAEPSRPAIRTATELDIALLCQFGKNEYRVLGGAGI